MATIRARRKGTNSVQLANIPFQTMGEKEQDTNITVLSASDRLTFQHHVPNPSTTTS